METPSPKRVHAPQGATSMTIEWSDAASTKHPHLVLRGLCPCAHCQGHQGGVRWVSEVNADSRLMMELREVTQVGNYALGLSWADGHSGGIYTFESLRKMAHLADWPIERLRELTST